MADIAAELAGLDPGREWAAWAPTPADPWGPAWAGHLLRRAAFGGSWSDVETAVRDGPDAALDRLFAGGPGLAEFDELMDATAPAAPPQRGQDGSGVDPAGADLEGWWLFRLVRTPHPFRERVTLFWHNHFATSVSKVRDVRLMRDQNALFRRLGLGPFAALAQAVSRDPALLVWLDSNTSVKGRANENLARELLELFTLGAGNFTETDVREAARAFTGWHTIGTPNGFDPGAAAAFAFDPAAHDGGPKTVLGKTGPWGGDDVVRLAAGHPACARHVVRKLYRAFVSEAATPPDTLITPLTDRFRASGGDVGALLKVVLRSRHFYSRFALRQRVKGPAEFVVGLVRGLGTAAPTPAGGLPVAAAVREIGQTLFAPPTVKGWDGGPAWLNTATTLARHNVAWRLLQDADPYRAKLDVPALAARHAPGADPAARARFLLDLLIQPAPGEVDARVGAKLAAFLADGDPRGPARDRRLREAAHVVTCLPLFQLA